MRLYGSFDGEPYGPDAVCLLALGVRPAWTHAARCAGTLAVAGSLSDDPAADPAEGRAEMPSSKDDFFEPRLRFGLRKPGRWRFRNAEWAPAALAAPLAEIDWARFSRLPFVSLARDVRSHRHPKPMLSVGCRPVARHGSEEIRRLLDRQAEVVRAELDDVLILDASYDTIVGGYRAAHVRFSYSQVVSSRGGPWTMRVLARSYLVLTPGLAFTIGMSSSADPQFGVPDEFAAVLASVRIGRPQERIKQPAAPARGSGGRTC